MSILKSLFAGKGEPREATDDNEHRRLAAAALMVEAACADERYTPREREIILSALKASFALEPDACEALLLRAESARAAANDLHQFTRHVKTLKKEEKTALIETLWSITLSDDARDPFEEALIRRICGLIYISDVESGAARRRVMLRSDG